MEHHDQARDLSGVMNACAKLGLMNHGYPGLDKTKIFEGKSELNGRIAAAVDSAPLSRPPR
ncbi:hypothetical protein BN1723_015825 [Verticillium longisporum]|uniref:Uncharacterized protein n=1 Tax=Verticillium longisporum TaxID=100787 RepID=A0A0G4N3D6_VERLO|nr:hypothetical protein BN1723_015825 [Verticillium longisporum]